MSNKDWSKSHVEIAAYWLWNDAGCPDDHAWDFWLKAEQLLENDRLREDPKYESLLRILEQ